MKALAHHLKKFLDLRLQFCLFRDFFPSLIIVSS